MGPRSGVGLTTVPLGARPFEEIGGELAEGAWERLRAARETASRVTEGRTIWLVNSTARGGGVAELIRTLVPYWRGSGIDARWLVIGAPAAFFELTKRLHNLLHGVPLRRPDDRDAALFDAVTSKLAARIVPMLRLGDLVVLEDPQTAGLVEPLKRAAATVVWRCHVGADESSEPVEEAWRFLLPRIAAADSYVFTRPEYVPPALDPLRVRIAAPAIDPRSAKNQPLSTATARAILARTGLVRGRRIERPPRVRVPGGRRIRVRRRCRVTREGAPPRLGVERLVVAVARWDRLKDPVGVIRGFAGHVDDPAARLVLAGPETGIVADDPEAGQVLREAQSAWRSLAPEQRARIQLAELPMRDLDENALVVNALQRQAAVIVKKSVQEGFGLGVTEGLWKSRPVVATGVGGHRDQIEHRVSGLLVDDPGDLAAFGIAVSELLDDPGRAHRMAIAGRERVRGRFLADRHFVDWSAAIAGMLAEGAAATG